MSSSCTSLRPEISLSAGRLASVEEPVMRYDADTLRGSAGGPVLDASGSVLAMHFKGGVSAPRARRDQETLGELSTAEVGRYSEGLTVTPSSRTCAERPCGSRWRGITGPADVAAAEKAVRHLRPERPPPLDELGALLQAAVHWSLDPADLPSTLVEHLLLVEHAGLPRWTLPGDVRASVLRRAAGLDALREARGDAPSPDGRQQVIDQILAGPPFSL